MVASYVPDAGDIVFLDFDPQVGREQAKRRPALVLTDVRYNRASGLAVVCPLTSKRKPYPFALPVTVGKIEGAVLVDQLKSLDWASRRAEFHSKQPRLSSPKSASTSPSCFPFATPEAPEVPPSPHPTRQNPAAIPAPLRYTAALISSASFHSAPTGSIRP